MLNMLEFLNTTLGIIVSILTLCGIGIIARGITKEVKQKTKDNGISSNSEGDSANMTGGSLGGGNGTINLIGNNNTVIQKSVEDISGNEQSIQYVDLKSTCQILFIDDESLPTIIKTLKKAGWKHIRRIADTANLDLIDIKNANIIFVDIKGVGKELGFKNEGIGLGAALKEKYPQKGVVLYSATPEHNLFDPDIDKVDGRLFKNAEPIQFSNMIKQYGKPKN